MEELLTMRKITAFLSLVLLCGAAALSLTACEIDVDNSTPVRGIGMTK
jgi:hypothetical protein